MSLAQRVAKVRLAQQRVARAQADLQRTGNGLLADSRAHPLTTLAVAAGAGTLLGALKLPVGHVPGLTGLLAGGMAGVTTLGARLLAEMAVVELAAGKATNDLATADDAVATVGATPPVADAAGT